MTYEYRKQLILLMTISPLHRLYVIPINISEIQTTSTTKTTRIMYSKPSTQQFHNTDKQYHCIKKVKLSP
jgi:hypothetical protein